MRAIKSPNFRQFNAYSYVDSAVLYYCRQYLPAYSKKVNAVIAILRKYNKYSRPLTPKTELSFKLL